MKDPLTEISQLQRPRLLIRAARLGQADYNRGRDLARLIRSPVPPLPGRALALLIEAEARLEAIRRDGEAGYSLTRHIELLIALLAEARLFAGGAESRALT